MSGTTDRPGDNRRSLRRLLARWQEAVLHTNHLQPPRYEGPDVLLDRLTEVSGEAGPGACFVARVRATSDGHPYIPDAIANGASMVLAQRPAGELGLTIPEGVVYLQVEDTAEALAWLAAAWEEFPSRHLVTIGITGTDGKSSTANILYEILARAGLKVGLLSTIRAVIGDREETLALHVTTPEAPVVQSYLRRMVDAGVTHCILEATSHALAQHRVTAVDFDVALVTNITHEHLDYHGDFEAYFAAKARLFDMVAAAAPGSKPSIVKCAVLNRDDASFSRLSRVGPARQVSYGLRPPADVYATHMTYAADRTRFKLHLQPPTEGELELSQDAHLTESIEVVSRLVGEFNVYNMLAAAAAASELGVSPALIQAGLGAVEAIDGRMQRIDRGQAFLVVVDFAHTPNALKKAIETARQMTRGRVITVFGSAGKRDVDKRRLMAETSAREADLTILTAEDPRTEPLDEILAMMAGGCRSQGGIEGMTFWRIADRGQAIYFGLSRAAAGDIVLVCGKGHEQSMCFGTVEYPWDDREATRTALDCLLQGIPLPDLGLPTSG